VRPCDACWTERDAAGLVWLCWYERLGPRESRVILTRALIGRPSA
jgi:hypothetical protein